MANIKQTFKVTILNDGGSTVATTTAIKTAEAEENFNITLAASSSNTILLSIAFANMIAFYITTDKAVSLELNNPATQTIALAADQVYWWNADAGTNPITVNVTTGFKFINGTGAVANIRGGFLVTV